MPASPLLINNPPISPVIICTGFHRSATSLTAQLLHSGGLDMGRRLVANHISNPDGHFEDVEMVRSEEHTSELQSLMRISYAVFCLKKKNQHTNETTNTHTQEPTP